jgi:hypothetical protein
MRFKTFYIFMSVLTVTGVVLTVLSYTFPRGTLPWALAVASGIALAVIPALAAVSCYLEARLQRRHPATR